MEKAVIYTFISVIFVSFISLIGVFTLSFSENRLKKFVFVTVGLSAGALLGDAFFHIIPEGFEEIPGAMAGALVLSGIMLFFIMEAFLEWRHSHGESEETLESEKFHDHGTKPLGTMILISDGLHNFIDGVVIAASFLVNPTVGVATTAAIILHEIPQEIANFGILLHSGMSKGKALFYNFISALTSVAGAVAAIIAEDKIDMILPVILLVAAGSFIYIAGSDLVPELRKTGKTRDYITETLSVLLGAFIMGALLFIE